MRLFDIVLLSLICTIEFGESLEENDGDKLCIKLMVPVLILARGGSKGIPLKNLVKIDGVSLLGRAIDEVRMAGVFSEIWVSTDHPGIADEAIKNNAKVHHRPPHLALDTTPSIDAVKEFLSAHENMTHIALVQCTSVFQHAKYLVEALEKFQESKDCVFAVTRSHKLRWGVEEKTRRLYPINFDVNHRPRRQDWNGELIETGMFYFAKRDLIMDGGVFQNGNCDVVEIDKRYALEIDDFYDLTIARFLVETE